MFEYFGPAKLLKKYILRFILLFVFNLIVSMLPGQLSIIKQSIVFAEVGCAGYWCLVSERRVPIRILIWASFWSMVILSSFYSELRLPSPMTSGYLSDMRRWYSFLLSPAIWLSFCVLPSTILLCSLFVVFRNWSLISKSSNKLQLKTIDFFFATALLSFVFSVFMAICPYDGFLGEFWEFLSEWWFIFDQTCNLDGNRNSRSRDFSFCVGSGAFTNPTMVFCPSTDTCFVFMRNAIAIHIFEIGSIHRMVNTIV